MSSESRFFLAAGAIAAFLAVAFGAFGAHALKNRLPTDAMIIFGTAVQYHFWHALGLLAIGVIGHSIAAGSLLNGAGYFMLSGIVLFSGSLYALSLTGLGALGAITPLGGVCFLVAWGLLVTAVLRA